MSLLFEKIPKICISVQPQKSRSAFKMMVLQEKYEKLFLFKKQSPKSRSILYNPKNLDLSLRCWFLLEKYAKILVQLSLCLPEDVINH